MRSIGWLGVSEIWFRRLPDLMRTTIARGDAKSAMHLNDTTLAADEEKIRAELAKKMTIIPESELDLAAFRDRLKGLPEEFSRTWKKGLYEQIVATK